MADAIQDILSLTQAFGQFSNSVIQLHNTRVKAETDAKTVLINKANYDFMQRFNLNPGDPNRISLDPGQNYWRDALKDYEGQVENHLGSISNPRVQNAVRQNLQAGSQDFALKLSNVVAQAEIKQTQEYESVAMQGLMDIRADKQVQHKLAYWEESGIFSPAQIHTFKESVLRPYQAKGEASSLISDGSKVGKNITAIMGEVSNNETYTTSYRNLILGNMQAKIEANSVEYDARMASYAEKIKNGGKVSLAEYQAVAKEFQGNVSLESYYKNLPIMSQVEFTSGKEQLDEMMTGFYSAVGMSFDKDGNPTSARKRIYPGEAYVQKAILATTIGPLLSGNTKLREEYNKELDALDKYIEEYPDQTEAGRKTARDAVVNSTISLYKLGLITGSAVTSLLMKNAKEFTTAEYTRFLEEIETGGYITDLSVKRIISDRQAMEDALEAVTQTPVFQKTIGQTAAAREVLDMLEGKINKENWMLQEAGTELFSAVIARLTAGKNPTMKDFHTAVTEAAVNLMEAYNDGFMDDIKLGSDAKWNENLNTLYGQIQGGAGSYGDALDPYGNVLTSTKKAAVLQIVDSVAAKAIAIADPSLSNSTFLTYESPDGLRYVYSNQMRDHVYKVSPGPGESITIQKHKIGSHADGSPPPFLSIMFASKMVKDYYLDNGNSNAIRITDYLVPVEQRYLLPEEEQELYLESQGDNDMSLPGQGW